MEVSKSYHTFVAPIRQTTPDVINYMKRQDTGKTVYLVLRYDQKTYDFTAVLACFETEQEANDYRDQVIRRTRRVGCYGTFPISVSKMLP